MTYVFGMVVHFDVVYTVGQVIGQSLQSQGETSHGRLQRGGAAAPRALDLPPAAVPSHQMNDNGLPSKSLI